MDKIERMFYFQVEEFFKIVGTIGIASENMLVVIATIHDMKIIVR